MKNKKKITHGLFIIAILTLIAAIIFNQNTKYETYFGYNLQYVKNSVNNDLIYNFPSQEDKSKLLDIRNSINLIEQKSSKKLNYPIAEEEMKILENAIDVRNQIAKNAGFNNYYDYCMYINNDLYEASDVENLMSDVKEIIVPLSLSLEKLLLDKYNFTLDFQNGDVYLKPDEIMNNVCTVYKDSSPELSEFINYINEKSLMSIPMYGLTTTINLRITESNDIIPIAYFETFHHTVGPINLMNSLGVLNDLYRNMNNDKSYANNYDMLFTRKSLRYLTYLQYDKIYGQYADYSKLIDICYELREVLKTAALCEIAQEIYSTDDISFGAMKKLTKEKYQEYGTIQNEITYLTRYDILTPTISVINQSSVSDFASLCLYRLSSLELMRSYYSNPKLAYDKYIELVDMRDVSSVTETMHKLELSSPFDDDYIETLSKFLIFNFGNI